LASKLLLRAMAALLLVALFVSPVVSSALAESPKPYPPDIAAQAAIAIDADTGEVIFEKNSHAQLPIASTTKLMTAILAMEHSKLDDVVTIKAEDLVGEASMGLREDERVSMQNLLYGMLLPSGNDAAMAIARHIGEGLTDPADASPVTRFVALMNTRAAQMGLKDTHFANPHGLDDPNHFSSAADLAVMAREYKKHGFLNTVAATQYYEAAGHQLSNLNKLLSRYEGADGLKTGQTDNSGLCLVASAHRNDMEVITVVLNSGVWYDDAAALLNYSFDYISSLPPSARAAANTSSTEKVLFGEPNPSTTLAAGQASQVQSDWQVSALLKEWPTLALAVLVAFFFISVIRTFVTFTTSRVSPDERAARQLATVQAGQPRSLGMLYDGPENSVRIARRTRPARRFSLRRSEPKQQQVAVPPKAEVTPERVLAVRQAATILSDRVKDIAMMAENGNEDGATMGIIRMLRNSEATATQLTWAFDESSPQAISCLVRAFLVVGEKEPAKSMLRRAVDRYPQDSRLRILSRLVD
jgi:serine-type D-Ala-D-Ala carboxypeptidase (penicillin-binding protein 5/6)